ncbi:hypothetical protein FD755_010417, partial [Muntiacus reevesi]
LTRKYIVIYIYTYILLHAFAGFVGIQKIFFKPLSLYYLFIYLLAVKVSGALEILSESLPVIDRVLFISSTLQSFSTFIIPFELANTLVKQVSLTNGMESSHLRFLVQSIFGREHSTVSLSIMSLRFSSQCYTNIMLFQFFPLCLIKGTQPEYWKGMPFPGDLTDPGIQTCISLILQVWAGTSRNPPGTKTPRSKLSGSDLPGDEWLWDFEKHGHRRSVIRRVKRFLSAHEHASSPGRRSYGRQASDSSMFFPPSDLSPTRDLLDVPPRSHHRASAAGRHPRSPKGSPKLHSSLGELATIRESSLSPQSSVRGSPTKTPQASEVLATASRALVPVAEHDHRDSTASIQSSDFAGLQPSRPEQQEDPVGSVPCSSERGVPPRDPRSQTGPAKAEKNSLKSASEEDPHEKDKSPQKWRLLESSRTSLAGLSLDPMNPEPLPFLDPETASDTSGITFAAGPRVSPDVLYLMENLDTKETDIVEFSNDQTEESPKGRPEHSRTWF